MLRTKELPTLSSKVELKATRVFEETFHSQKRFVVNQGGTRSGKTYGVCQAMIVKAAQGINSEFDIIRKHFPSLKASIMKDFFDILLGMGAYSEKFHNKTENIYRYNGSTFNFYSLDEPQKIRGRKRDYVVMNEANEFTYEDFQQINWRTNKQLYLDFNPSDEYHWIYEKVLGRTDCQFIHSTYLDNPFIPNELKKEIELLKDQDENYWKIYGLGERGMSQQIIYTNWDEREFPDTSDVFYGLDFGYNNKTALVKVAVGDGEIFCKVLIYEVGMTNSDLISRLAETAGKNDEIYADSQGVEKIEEISREGFNIRSSDKSVFDGIDFLKRFKIHIDPESEGLIKEIKSYRWKTDKEGRIVTPEQPVKFNDHALDALRYACYTKLNNPFTISVIDL